MPLAADVEPVGQDLIHNAALDPVGAVGRLVDRQLPVAALAVKRGKIIVRTYAHLFVVVGVDTEMIKVQPARGHRQLDGIPVGALVLAGTRHRVQHFALPFLGQTEIHLAGIGRARKEQREPYRLIDRSPACRQFALGIVGIIVHLVIHDPFLLASIVL